MKIIKATEQDTINIMNMISECIKSMAAQGIYLFNKAYPSSEIIENDIKNGSGFIFRDNNNCCIAYVAINEDQAPEYSQIHWSTDGSKVLVIHRLFVHPESQGKGIARKFIGFIEDFAIENRYSCIRLDAYSENTQALRLYDGIGYQRLGQIFFPFKDLPFYCYEKALDYKMGIKIIGIREHPQYLEKGIDYFAQKWNIDRRIYADCISNSITTYSPIPRWYLMLKDDEIIGGFGLITNDFISRQDLFPWFCALYVEESERGNQLGCKMLEYGLIESAKLGYKKLYLCTDLDNYYEKYGWNLLATGFHPWGEESKIYEKETMESTND